ncbi:MAG: hypothetical protein MPW15_11965 [Candidatus Manganitrophus sp.]|nr:hypothetical protein [Candidatus Manganitrophus sp.]
MMVKLLSDADVEINTGDPVMAVPDAGQLFLRNSIGKPQPIQGGHREMIRFRNHT